MVNKTNLNTNKVMKLKNNKYKRKEIITCYLMIAAPIIGFLVLSLYPIVWTFRWSFFQYTGVPSETFFVGLKNFITIFTRDNTYWSAWINTLLLVVLKLPLEFTLVMIISLVLMGKNFKGAGVYRAVYYTPHIVSVVIIGLIFSNLFGFFGWINSVLLKFGIISEGINWFASKWTAFVVLILGSIWSSFGVNVMYVCAALSNVPEEIYEAANLDGANAFVKFFKLTLPMIAPVFKTVLLLALLGTLSTNDYIIAMTNGAPGGQTHTVLSYMTTQFVPGFMSVTAKPNLGYGSALGVITTIIFALIAALQNKFSSMMSSEN